MKVDARKCAWAKQQNVEADSKKRTKINELRSGNWGKQSDLSGLSSVQIGGKRQTKGQARRGVLGFW